MPRGGYRPGAGRKKAALSRAASALRKATAEEILAQIDEKQFWLEALKATVIVSGGKDRPPLEVPNWAARIESAKYLTDRRDGKPIQAIKPDESGKLSLGYGSLPTPAEFRTDAGTADKPN